MPERRVLQDLSINRTKGHELSPYRRGQIIGQANAGRTNTQIAKDLKIPVETVATTIRRASARVEGVSQPRRGAPSKTDARDRRAIQRVVKKFPDASYAKIRSETALNLSSSTIYRILDSLNMGHWIAKKRPVLDADHAKARLEWALERKNWTDDDWAKVIFTDECSLERGSGKRPRWIWCYKGQRLDPDKVDTFEKGKDLSIMIWAAIWLADRSNIGFMKRDEEAPRGGYSARSYIEILEEHLPQIYDPAYIWQQDNASIHTATHVATWLAEHGVRVLKWPANSPDLNPIEHCWSLLKDYLNQHYSHLEHTGQSQQATRALQEAIEQSWLAVEQEAMDGCIKSMRRRVAAVIKAKGWYTKY